MPSLVVGIFVGGASSRMGAPKGRVCDAEGAPLLERLVTRARAMCLPDGDDVRLVLVGNASPYADVAPDLTRLDDARAGVGPLGGLVALLRYAGPDHVLALSCDLPFVDTHDLEALARHVSRSPIVAARRDGDAPFEPLFARYEAPRVLALAEAHLARGEHSLQRLLVAAGAEPFAARIEAIRDWDTPQDVAREGGRIPGPESPGA